MANILGPKHVAQLGAYIREQRESAQYSLRQLAQAAGVSNPYLSQIERGLRKPSAEILQQLAKALKISAETLYVQAGLLDGATEPAAAHADADAEAATEGAYAAGRVLAAINADPLLTRRQRQILREIYQTFRAESAAAHDRGEAFAGPARANGADGAAPDPAANGDGFGRRRDRPDAVADPDRDPSAAPAPQQSRNRTEHGARAPRDPR